jgi:hypothetical protein
MLSCYPLIVRRALPVLLLFLLPLALFPGVLAGRSISAHDHLSVHHAFQSEAGGHVRHPLLSDPAVQFAALRERVVQDLRSGHAPLWNPDIYGGAPLLADGQSMVGSPVTWLHLVLPTGPAQTLGALGLLGWTGLGAWLLLRSLKLPEPQALLGAAAVITGPFTSVWLLHPHAATFCWIPGLLWAIEKRSAPLVALTSAGLLAGGHPETAAHGLIIAAVWALVRARSLHVVLGLILGGLLSAPVTLPLLDAVLGSATAQAHGGNRILASQLLDLVWPSFHGHPATQGYSGAGVWADGVLHPGLATLGLGLASLRFKAGRVLLAGWLVCVVLALVGTPVLNSARLGTLGALFVALAAAWSLSGRWAWLGLVAVVTTGVWARWHDQGTLRALPEPAPWTEELVERAGEGRVVGLGWALQPNTGSLVGLRDLRGYDLPVSVETEALMSALDRQIRRPWFPIESIDASNRGVLEFAAVRFVLAPEMQYGLAPVALDSPAPLQVYALDLEAPRAWLATGARSATSRQQALGFLQAGYAGRGNPPVEGLGPARLPPEGEALPVELEDVAGSEVRVVLPEGHRGGLLVLADRFDEGWQVEVDGQEGSILRTGGYFRGVEVAPGAREATFRYRPTSFRLGLLGGLLGLLGLGGYLARMSRFRGVTEA